ncbi:hypothetical protein P7K49_002665, partial [Saguinus oedipus]
YELGTTENEEDAPLKGVTLEYPPNGVMERLLKLTAFPLLKMMSMPIIKSVLRQQLTELLLPQLQ